MPERTQGVVLMLGSCVFFAAMALCVSGAHLLDRELSTFVTSAMRAGVNLLVLVILVRGDVGRLVGDRRPALFWRGVTGAFSLLTYFGALERIGVGEAAFLNQTSAAWVAMMAPFVLGEPTRRLTWVAIGLSLWGASLLVHPRDGEWLGRGLGLASGLCAAAAYLAVRKAGSSNEPITIVFYFTFLATVVAGGLVLLAQPPLPHDPYVLLCLVGSGIFATLGQLFMTRAYQLAPAALAASVSAAAPLLTTLGGWWLLKQQPDLRGMVGMALLTLASIALPYLSARSAR